MAKARMLARGVTVTLEMDGREAQVLADIFMRIGGSPAQSRRKEVDAIHEALRDTGVRGAVNPNDMSGSMLFLSEE